LVQLPVQLKAAQPAPAGRVQPLSPTTVAQRVLLRQGTGTTPTATSPTGSGYWDMGGWRDGQRAPRPVKQAAVAGQRSPTGQAGKPALIKRVNSAAYWDADQWDPDQRVYVGADIGQKNHLVAVDLTKAEAFAPDAELFRAWPGGLTGAGLGQGAGAGPLLNLGDAEKRPKLQELYRINELSVGTGSFGVVRPARHSASGTACVVKAVNKAAAGDQYRMNLVDGGLGAELLRMSRETPHPNVAMYLDLLEGPRHFYVVMEELSGPELLQQMEDMFPMTEAYLQLVLRQVLASLAHIHDVVGLFHRDIKLANFKFRTQEPGSELVLLDFGFAARTCAEWDGSVSGTLMFMAPEVVGSRAKAPFLPAMDIWAVGVILFTVLTGDSPIQDTEVQQLGKGGEAAQELLAKAFAVEALTQASGEVLDLLRRLLDLEPSSRATAAQALEHPWFASAGGDRRVSLTSDQLRLVRQTSRVSEIRKPPLRKVSRTGSGFALAGSGSPLAAAALEAELPRLGPVGLERVVSEGEDEHAPE